MSMVFVSYSRGNQEVVKQLVADLQAVGVETWHDQSLTGGQRWWESILAKIRACDIFIFALSPESWASEACKSELSYVALLGKPILPVLISDGINLNLLTHPLNQIQVTDYRLRDKAATLALFKAINTSPAAPPLPDPLPVQPAVPLSYVITLQERIDSHAPLSPQDQNLLYMDIEEAIEEGGSPKELHDLILNLKKRDDLLAKVCGKLDVLLKKLESRSTGPTADDKVNEYRADSGSLVKPMHCPKCAAPAAQGAIFCGSCGTKLSGAGGANFHPNGPHAQSRQGWKSCRYICTAREVTRVVTDVVGWLDAKGFDCAQQDAGSEGLLLKVNKRGEGRNYLGMSTSVTILFRQSDDTLTVEIGAAKWGDKVGAGAVSLLVFAPLAVTAGMGIWEQAKMPERIFEFIGTRLPYR
ncbi:MAG TPA: TIR domain-containing protein [Pyrinomonadaceae bacterium]|jgi:hypothetical protein|nr:TIR domain-containing protein [Pyrinomonadaceae bacterium]